MILPSPFVAEWIGRLSALAAPPRPALDLATGRGRHAVLLAAAGLKVFGVDRRIEALLDARQRLREAHAELLAWCADLERDALPASKFDLIVVTRYLQRDLFPALRDALTPGGAIIYETFTEAQRAMGRGPTSPDHLLRAGELRSHFAGFEILVDEEVSEPEALARVVARRPQS